MLHFPERIGQLAKRILLGAIAYQVVERKLERMQTEIAQWKATDFPQ